MTETGLKQGDIFSFQTPEKEDLKCADVFYSQKVKRFFILFNGKPETFVTYKGLKGRVDKIIQRHNLTLTITEL